jgi:GAF domain-containing protein
MEYDFYVEAEGSWFGVYPKDREYVCVEQHVKPFTTTYPINTDPENWINTVQRQPAMQDKPALTAEQQRTLKDFKEQVAQLDQSIKLNEQDVAHKMILISSYKARQDELLDKIAEINGEELPSVTKAKGIRAELDKLKGNV